MMATRGPKIVAATATLMKRGNNYLKPFMACCLSTRRQEERQAERAAKRARRESMAKKRAEMDAFLQSQTQQLSSSLETKSLEKEAAKRKELQELSKQHEERREVLMQEASALTLSLYRTCMRCVKLMLPGNEHDEKEFQEREAAQLKAMEEALSEGDVFSMSPPVDRENELSSRSRYYRAWAKEGFEQESDCLDHNPWREQDVERYLYFLRKGEYRRKWVLKDYKFDDPYPDSFDNERVNKFEEEARMLLRDSYKAQGWMLESEQD